MPLPAPARPVSLWRALILGMALIPVNALWVTLVEVRWNTLDGTSLPLFITPIFFLFALVLLNLLWRKVSPRPGASLRQEELLLVYVMLVVSCTFAGHDTLQNMFGEISHPYWYATKDNHWQQLFFEYLPSWLLVSDHAALSGFYTGHVSIYSLEGRQFLVSWIVPLAAWGAFFLTLVGIYLCMTILVRKPWVESEKLTFPLVQLPLAMTAADAEFAFWKNPRMWAGFGIAFGISFLNGLHELIPSIPDVQIHPFDIGPLMTNKPWSAIGQTRTTFYPFAVGIAYFMPLDLSFSCWFFFVASRAFRIVGSAAGWDAGAGAAGFPFFGEQATGAWLGLGAMLLYAGRGSWREAGRLVRLGSASGDPKEALRLRCAVLGIAAGLCGLAVFSRLIGMSLWVGVGFFGIVLLLGFTITRVRAELGAPHEINFINPAQVLVTCFGTSALGPQNLTALAMLHWFNRGYRNHPMPNQLEAFKMLEDKPGARFGGIVTALVASSLVSLVSVYWANLHVTYLAGATGKAVSFKGMPGGDEAFAPLASWITQPRPPATTGLSYIAGGLILTVFLAAMRSYFVWWPFHPAGYALAFSFAMEYFWLPVFLAWTLKALLLRYGGIGAYRSGIPLFLGLILGDYTMGSLWSLIGLMMGIPTYRIYI